MIVRVFFILISILFFKNSYCLDNKYEFENNTVELILSEKINNSVKFGLYFKLDKDWKIYWIFPGDAGSPPMISSTQKGYIQNLKVSWPLPHEDYDKKARLTTRVYKNEIILPVKMTINEDLVENNKVPVKLEFQICKDICIPITTSLFLDYPDKNYVDKKSQSLLKVYENKVPQNLLKQSKFKLKSIKNIDNKIFIKISSEEDILIKNSNIFAYVIGEKIPTYRNLSSNIEKNEISIILISESISDVSDKDMTVFLSIDEENYYIESSLKLENNSKNVINNNTLTIIIISFIGGFILNFMPCVFPILGLKITKFLKQIEVGDPLKLKLSSFYVCLGIIFTFLILAIITIIFKTMGISFGWGIQFQEPIFLYFLILVLLVFSLNLFGVFNIKMPKINFSYLSDTKKNNTNIFFSNFFTGIISTILSTPCTAPFVGTAVSIALSQGNYITVLIFLFMGLGKSFPYLLFVMKPNIINSFPRPGKWMVYMKFIFGFLFIISIFWLISLLINHYSSSKKYNPLKENGWIEFKHNEVKELVKNGQPVIVDITAKWCITCKINKKNVLDNKEIIKILEEKNIKRFRGDWTLPDEEILNYLKYHGKFGIPFNIIYTENYKDGIMFSEILTKKNFLNTLSRAFP